MIGWLYLHLRKVVYIEYGPNLTDFNSVNWIDNTNFEISYNLYTLFNDDCTDLVIFTHKNTMKMFVCSYF